MGCAPLGAHAYVALTGACNPIRACRYVASGLANVTAQGTRYLTYCYNHATTGAWTLVMRVSRRDGSINFYHNGEGWRRAEFKPTVIASYDFRQPASTAWGNNDCKPEPRLLSRPVSPSPPSPRITCTTRCPRTTCTTLCHLTPRLPYDAFRFAQFFSACRHSTAVCSET